MRRFDDLDARDRGAPADPDRGVLTVREVTVHVKQLIDSGRFVDDDTPVREFVRPVMFVPETKKIDELLREFQEKKSHLAIVVDEYGGTAGMATLEDVLEELLHQLG